MAAFGILAALRERDRSGEGQLVDVSMADGALSWLAMVAARYFADGVVPQRGDARAGGLARLLPALRVRRRLGDARRAGAEVLAGVVPRRRPRGPDRAAVRRARARTAHARGRGGSSASARAPSGRRSPPSTTAAWSRCSTSTRRWTPSSCARARWSSSSTSRAPSAGAAARRAGQARRARRATPRARPARRSASTPTRCCAAAGYGEEEIARAEGVRRGRRARRPSAQGSFLAMSRVRRPTPPTAC